MNMEHFTPERKLKAAVIGATGAVGQRFVQLLARHPWFELGVLAASERSTGKRYAEACNWVLDVEMPEQVKEMPVIPAEPGFDADVVFSALPADQALELEPRFAQAGYPVFSNASAFRYEEDVPLVIPEVNPDHLKLVEIQKANRGWPGFIVTNPNCSTTHLTLALKPIHDAFGLKKVLVVTMQAVSGAGYPGVPSLDILGNVIPYIGKEEWKLENEPRKLLGTLSDGRVAHADFVVSAHANRVPVRDGHTEAVSLSLQAEASPEAVAEALRGFTALPQKLGLPSAPAHPVVVRNEPNRPQPHLDLMAEKGMATVVGRVRQCPILGHKFVLLGHNTIRGAAGGSILNAELALAMGVLR
jgi:aspartate-semialdehyde dehydrogenase